MLIKSTFVIQKKKRQTGECELPRMVDMEDIRSEGCRIQNIINMEDVEHTRCGGCRVQKILDTADVEYRKYQIR